MNVVDSSIARRASAVSNPRRPGDQVASTEGVHDQLTALYLLPCTSDARGLVTRAGPKLLAISSRCPTREGHPRGEAAVERIARRYAKAPTLSWAGVNYRSRSRGAQAEGDLFIHAEGYPAGEMKHGPIALINEQMPVVGLIPTTACSARRSPT